MRISRILYVPFRQSSVSTLFTSRSTMSRLFILAGKLLLRDWRSGELGILLAALIVAVAASTTVGLLSERLNRTLSLQAAEFLGADLSVSGHATPAPEWDTEAAARTLRSSHTAEFASVLIENDELLLVGVKAVAAGYPLRGALKTTPGDLAATEETHDIPPPGEIWVEPRLLSSLKLAVGDEVTVGEKKLRLTRLVTYEPDRRGDLYSLAPRVLMNQADLAATRIVQPGSHVHYYALYAGEENALRAFKTWLTPRMHLGQRITDIHEDRPELGNALSRAERYLGLASIAVVMIAGVAIAMSTRRYAERHFDLGAMLKALGAREREVLGIFLLQLLGIGLIGSLLGCAAGYGLQWGLAWLLRSLLPHGLVQPGFSALLLGAGSGLLILFGFGLPPVLRLKRLPPLRVLRRDLEPLPSSAWLVYGCAVLTLGALLWRHTRDWTLTATVLAGGGAALAGFALLGWFLLRLAGWLAERVPLAWRFGLRQLARRPRVGVTQVLAFGVTLVAMLLSLLVRTELLQEWKRQLPANAPNHFALNLFDADLERFRAALAQERIPASQFFPIVRGRLIRVDGQDVLARVAKNSRAEGAINRELSLTYSADLPPDNRVVEGRWWNPGETGLKVSVEEKLAQDLGLKPGSRLTFNVAGQEWDADVVGTRSLRWDTMAPNFFMIFPPGSLDAYPHTWLTSFYLAPGQNGYLAQLAKSFPTMTLLEVDRLLEQFQAILRQVAQAIEYVLWLALAAGFTVLFAAVRATLDERIYEDVLMRTMGASRRLLRRAQWVEFSALGFLAGLLAAVVAEWIAFGLYTRVFDLEPRFHWEAWLATPALGAMVVGCAGWWNTRSVVNHSPMRVLREL